MSPAATVLFDPEVYVRDVFESRDATSDTDFAFWD
jgi:hypothetical protein